MVCTSSLIRPLSLLLCLSLPSALPSVHPPPPSLSLSPSLSPSLRLCPESSPSLFLSPSLPLSLSISVCVQRTLSRTSPSTSRSPSSPSCHSKTYVRRHLPASCSPSSCPAAYLRKKRCFLCLSRACLGKRNTFCAIYI